MLSTILIVFTFMIVVVGIMAVGVIFGRKPISGSCGGMAAVGMEAECDVCGGDKTKCDGEDEPEGAAKAKSPVAYFDATK